MSRAGWSASLDKFKQNSSRTPAVPLLPVILTLPKLHRVSCASLRSKRLCFALYFRLFFLSRPCLRRSGRLRRGRPAACLWRRRNISAASTATSRWLPPRRRHRFLLGRRRRSRKAFDQDQPQRAARLFLQGRPARRHLAALHRSRGQGYADRQIQDHRKRTSTTLPVVTAITSMRTDNVVVPNIELGKDPKPPGTQYKGAPMPYYMRIAPGFGLHAGYLPGYPASHGCIRMPEFMAENFFKSVSDRHSGRDRAVAYPLARSASAGLPVVRARVKLLLFAQ